MTLPMMLVPFLLLLALPGGDRSPADTSVVQAYDLSSALPGSPARGGGQALLPYLVAGWEQDHENLDENHGVDTLINLLRDLCGGEFEYEGREIQVDDIGRLIVRAPPALQTRTRRYLEFLESVFGATADVEIDAVELPESATDAQPVPTLVPIAEVEKLLARGGDRGLRRWRLRLRSGSTSSLDLSRVASMVTDYNVEIAQAAAIADPIVEDVETGTRILARGAPAEGGMWLSLILRRGDPISEVQDRDLPVEHPVTTPERIVFSVTSRLLQTVEVLNRSMAIDTFLPEGKALVIQTRARVATKSHGEILVVRRVAGALPLFRRVSLDSGTPGGPSDVLFVDASSAQPPRCEIHAGWIQADPMGSPGTIVRAAGWGAQTAASFTHPSSDLLQNALAAGDDDLRLYDVGPSLFLWRETPRGGGEAAGTARKGEEKLAILAQMTPSPRLAQVSLVLRRAGGGPELARCALPLRAGNPAYVVLGAERIEIADFDVEVAQSAAVADSIMRVAFDGLEVWLKPSFALSGDLSLEVSARAHVRRGDRREVDLGVPSLGSLDESTYDQLLVRERLVFGKGEGAARRFVLGDSAEQAGTGSLALEVEAIEVK